MRLFKLIKNETLSEIKEAKIAKEKTLQSITENNLSLLFGLEFVCSEFSVGDYRLDTLAFDPETSSFVIIEYKRSENRSVIDQGYAYLGKMLDRKAEFVLKFSNVKNKRYDINDIDWAQSRIYFVSTAFNNYQLGSLIFNDLPISLWEVKTYHDEHISFRRIDYGSSSASIKKIAPTNAIGKVAKELEVYTEADHIQKANEDIRTLYETVRDNMLTRWNLTLVPRKLYLAFKGTTNIVDIEIQRAQLKLTLNVPKGKLMDNLNIAEDVSGKGKWGNGAYQIIMKDESHLSHILSLIEQSVKLHS
jgi:predicted transport protein